MVAGHDLFGGNLIIVDFGTATTFDVVDADGAYIGGVIAPGGTYRLALQQASPAACGHCQTAVYWNQWQLPVCNQVCLGIRGVDQEICARIQHMERDEGYLNRWPCPIVSGRRKTI